MAIRKDTGAERPSHGCIVTLLEVSIVNINVACFPSAVIRSIVSSLWSEADRLYALCFLRSLILVCALLVLRALYAL
jgi:hypothetical protein